MLPRTTWFWPPSRFKILWGARFSTYFVLCQKLLRNQARSGKALAGPEPTTSPLSLTWEAKFTTSLSRKITSSASATR